MSEKKAKKTRKEKPYLIRLTNDKNLFIHFQKVNQDKDGKLLSYQVCEGKQGAALWQLENAKQFIKESGHENLEIISIDEVRTPIKQINGASKAKLSKS